MALKDIYMLPQTLLEDVDIWLKREDITVGDVYTMIEKRMSSEIKFTKRELSSYMVERRSYINAPVLDDANIIVLPRNANTDLKEGQDKSLDTQEFVNVRDRARLVHMLKEKLVRRMKIVEDAQRVDGKDYIDPYMESLVINYTKVLADLIEKEVKLQLELEESSKLEKIIDERINLVLFLVGKVTKKFIKKDVFDKYKEDDERYTAFIEEIKEVFRNYGIENNSKLE
jgi:hypothetical protein